MGNNPYAQQIAKEEKFYSAEISKELTKQMQARQVQQQADKKTNQSTPKIPREVAAVFTKALTAAVRKLEPKYAGMKITVTPSYKQVDGYWKCTVAASARYVMTSVGGRTHVIKPGETLWSISESYYGTGAYWEVIAKANPMGVSKKGDMILAGFPLKIPKLDILADVCVPADIKKKVKPKGAALGKGRKVAYPTLEFDLEKSKSIKQVFKMPGMTILVTTTLKGSIKASQPGTIPAGFNLRTFEAEVKNGMKPFETSVKVSKLGVSEIQVSSNVSKSLWKSSISITKDGAFKTSISPKPVKWKNKKVEYEGNVGLEIEMRFVPDRVKEPQPVPVGERVVEWVRNNDTVIIGGLVVGATVIVVGTLVADVASGGLSIADDPASFALASAMFGRALQMAR